MFALLFAAVTISAPAAARGMHELDHASSPVVSGEHHHHDEEGGVTSHGVDGDVDSPSDDTTSSKFGHSHVASMALDALRLGSVGFETAWILRTEGPAAVNTPALGTFGWCP